MHHPDPLENILLPFSEGVNFLPTLCSQTKTMTNVFIDDPNAKNSLIFISDSLNMAASGPSYAHMLPGYGTLVSKFDRPLTSSKVSNFQYCNSKITVKVEAVLRVSIVHFYPS